MKGNGNGMIYPLCDRRSDYWIPARTLFAARRVSRAKKRSGKAPCQRDTPEAGHDCAGLVEGRGRCWPNGVACTKCKSRLRLISLVKTEDLAQKILTAMH